MKTENSMPDLQSTTQPIIIFGAGLMGELLLELCHSNDVAVSCIVDNNPQKIGQTQNGIPIFLPRDIKEKYENPIFLISPITSAPQMAIRSQLSGDGYTEIYTAQQCIQSLPPLASRDILKQIQLHKVGMGEYKKESADFLYVETLNFVITERCSLKCRDCAHLMQYYEAPIHYKKEELFAYLDRIDDVFDSISEMPILGGEPLTSPDFYDIVRYAQQKETIQYILILTNGTILPKREELETFDPNKVGFAISDYGDISAKTEEIRTLLDEVGISYKCTYSSNWNDPGKIEFQNYTPQQLVNVLHSCSAKFCTAFSFGTIYMCPFLAHTSNLKAIPKNMIDGIDIMDTRTPLSTLKKEVSEYLYEWQTLPACQYCTGKSLSSAGDPIPPAIQTKETLPYKKYDA